MNLYVASISASRDSDSDPETLMISLSATCLLFEPDTGDDMTVEGSLRLKSQEIFPPTEGWRDHIEVPVEIFEGQTFEPPQRPGEVWVLHWSVEKKRKDEHEQGR